MRQVPTTGDEIIDTGDVQVEIDEGGQSPANDDGKILEITHDDGSITVSLDGQSLAQDDEDLSPPGWFDNLVDKISEMELGRIGEDLLRGISNDIESRRDWIEDRTNGIKLLGLKIEIPGLGSSTDGAPVEGMSRVRHPLLLEAVLRFQANARAEMLPTDGPVKIRNDDNNADLAEDQLANAMERDFNHYLTDTATEYYPDTDRMFFMLGFGGTQFKKVYFCPLRGRPVSETVDADDLIVNNNATDLTNAKRVTHRVMLKPSTVRRLQILGVYRDVELSTPSEVQLDSLKQEKLAQQGIQPGNMNADDRDREIYECYCELSIDGFKHKFKGKETGLDIPYRVTIDESSKKILSIVRNYDEPEKDELPESKKVFVKYTYVPGLGFYDIGLLHILGNTTNAITAAWREMLDAGMFANFPGFLMADTGARQNTNIFRVPPGGGALVKTGGMPISQAIMPLPYKEPGPALMTLVQNMADTGMRIGGTSEQQVGEGRADAPVGTTLALIEQAQKILNSVHKRMHAAQAEEFRMLRDCFKEHPESFWERNRKPAKQWDEQTFLAALKNYEFAPQADPNTASHVQRIMKVIALKQLQGASPALYDPIAVDTAALQSLGWSNPQQFLMPPGAASQPPPELLKMQADAENAGKLADAKVAETQSRIKNEAAKTQIEAQRAQSEGQKSQADIALDGKQLQFDQAKTQAEMTKTDEEMRNDADDRLFKERMNIVDTAQNLAVHPESAHLIEPLLRPAAEDLARHQKQAGLVPNGLDGQ